MATRLLVEVKCASEGAHGSRLAKPTVLTEGIVNETSSLPALRLFGYLAAPRLGLGASSNSDSPPEPKSTMGTVCTLNSPTGWRSPPTQTNALHPLVLRQSPWHDAKQHKISLGPAGFETEAAVRESQTTKESVNIPCGRACWDRNTNASPGATLTTSGETQMVQAHTQDQRVIASSMPTSSSML